MASQDDLVQAGVRYARAPARLAEILRESGRRQTRIDSAVASLGVISFAIIGMLYKIIPFLIWFGIYSKQIGRAQVPSLADLYSEKLQIVGYIAFVAGLGVTSFGILSANAIAVRTGCSLFAVSLGTLAVNVAIML